MEKSDLQQHGGRRTAGRRELAPAAKTKRTVTLSDLICGAGGGVGNDVGMRARVGASARADAGEIVCKVKIGEERALCSA